MRARKPVLVLVLGAGIHWSLAAVGNPYQPIVERNVFGLKPPPEPQPEQPAEPPKPPSKVVLTGISNLFTRRALLEITEQTAPNAKGPAPASTVQRPILAEGESAHGVEVLSIDLQKNVVRIRNGNVETDLTFEIPKSTPAAPTPPGPAGRQIAGVPGALGQPQNQPNALSRNEGNNTGVTLYGGGNSSQQANASGVTTYGGGNPAIPSPLGENGSRTIPQRPVRTPSPGGEQQMDPAQQAVLMEAERIRAQQRARNTRVVPPPPPLPEVPGQDNAPPQPQ